MSKVPEEKDKEKDVVEGTTSNNGTANGSADGTAVGTANGASNMPDGFKSNVKTTDEYRKMADEAYGMYAPQKYEISLDRPEKSDFMQTQDWYNEHFPTISKAEEEDRTNYVLRNAKWQTFGNALVAIANAIGGTQGVKPVALTEPKIADLQTWKDNMKKDRQGRATIESTQQKAYNDAMKTYNTALTRSLEDYNKRLANYNFAKAKYADELRKTDEAKDAAWMEAYNAQQLQKQKDAAAKKRTDSTNATKENIAKNQSSNKVTESESHESYNTNGEKVVHTRYKRGNGSGGSGSSNSSGNVPPYKRKKK